MKTSIKELKKIQKRIQKLIEKAEKAGTTEVEAEPNTYGLYGDYISIASVGFIPLTPEDDDYEWEEK